MSWIDVAAVELLARRHLLEVEAAGKALLLYAIDDAVYATAAICPHHAAWLSQGGVEDEFVDCPRHQGRFHIPTGRKVRGPDCADLATYKARVTDGRVEVDL